ncbi:MAG: hypothetical protein ACRDLD_06750 [Thermoleophilaceae bacterium]
MRALLSIALAATLLVAAPAAEAGKRKVPRGFFGVMWDRAAIRSSPENQEAQWALMAQSGVESVRTVVAWARAQPVEGRAPDFSHTDELVARAARHNMALLPIVLDPPDWAARNPGRQGSPPSHIGAYTAFLRGLVLRYGPSGAFWDEHPELPREPVRAWQIWNEPHIGFYWNTDGRSRNAWAREYARLLKASKPAIESVDPRATIVLAGLADFAWRHYALLSRYKIRRYFDVAALNFFTSRPKNVIKGVRYFRRALRRDRARRKPIWITETTWPAGKNRVARPRAAWQRRWYTTDRGMAKRLRGLYRLAARNRRRLRLGRVYWYTWASSYGNGDLFDYAGLVRYSSGQIDARPSLRAYRRSARRYQGCRKTSEGACRR